MQTAHGVQIFFESTFSVDNALTVFDALSAAIESAAINATLEGLENDPPTDELVRNRERLRKCFADDSFESVPTNPPQIGLSCGDFAFSPCTPILLGASICSTNRNAELVFSSVVYRNLVRAGNSPEDYPDFLFPGLGKVPIGEEILSCSIHSSEQKEEFDRLMTVMTWPYKNDPPDSYLSTDAYFPRWNRPALAFIWSRFRGVLPISRWEYWDQLNDDWDTEPAALRE